MQGTHPGESTRRRAHNRASIFALMLLGLALAAASAGCGGGGGGSSPSPPQIKNSWDEMEWDQGNWAAVDVKSSHLTVC